MKRNIVITISFIILLIISSYPVISGFQSIENNNNNKILFDSTVYSTTPDWISDNPHYSTGGAFADFNDDGWLDFVVADGNDIMMGHVNVYYNNEGAFPTTADWQSDDIGYNGHLDVADVNGDGWPDVAVSYLGTGSSFGPIARVYLNNEGTLSSLPDWNSDITGNAFGVDFGDMNNDGRPDLAVATGWSYSPQHNYNNYVYLNVDGTLESTASWVSDDTYTYQGCLWVDANNDSWLDLVGSGTGQEIKLYENLGGVLDTTASWQTSDSLNQDGIMLTYGDVNNDNIDDLFATDNIQLGGSGNFKQYTGIYDGFFETTYSWNYYEGYGSAVALADINADKKLDLATGGWWDYTRIFINNGLELPSNPSWNSSGTSVVEKIVFGNIGPDFEENTYIMDFAPDDDRKLFHLPHKPIQKIINAKLDDVILNPSEFTFSREHGWITVKNTPTESLEIEYTYSNSLDMAITNWDQGIGNYLYYNKLSFDSDLKCDGSLSWSDIKPGSTVVGNFTIENIGKSGSKLAWAITDSPPWGSWSYDPESGEDIEPEDGPVEIDVTCIAPDKNDKEYYGKIKIENLENPDDFCYIDLQLTTPKNKPFNYNHKIANWIIEHFLDLFPMLKYILRV